MRQPLSPDQQRSVEHFVRRKGKRCNVCGSEDLCCGAAAAPYLGGGFNVHLICINEEDKAHAAGFGLIRDYSITAEEARQIGLR
jgi:hypothetical protein